MWQLNENAFSMIQQSYADMTPVEQSIADFFLAEQAFDDLSLEAVSGHLFVSKASLSRFARSCGFDGYREFIYQFKRDLNQRETQRRLSPTTQNVLSDYQQLFANTVALIDEAQIRQVAQMMLESDRIFVYGDGLSGYAAGEFMVRFKRLGFQVEAFTDDFMIRTNSSIVQPGALVIGITVSGCTKNVLQGLQNAYKNKVKTVMITGEQNRKRFTSLDVVLRVGTRPHLNTGMTVSPQFPVLMMIDLLFNCYIETDYKHNAAVYQATLKALKYNWNNEDPED